MKSTTVQFGLYFLLVLIPFFYYPIVPDPAHSPIFLFISLIFGSVFFIFKKQENQIRHNKIISFLLLGIILIGISSIVFINQNSEAILELNRIIFLGLNYFFFIYILSKNKSNKNYLLYTLICIGIIYSFFGYIDLFKTYNSNEIYNGLYEIRAHIGHKNLLSIYIVVTFPWTLYYILNTDKNWNKIALIIYLVFSIILILILESRVGLIGILLNIIGIWYIYKIQISKKIACKIFIGACCLIGTLYYLQPKKTKGYIQRIESIFSISKIRDKNNQSILERKILWEATIKLIKDQPISGIGLGQWKTQVLSKDINQTRSKFGNIIFQQPHNDLLWVTSEYGLIGGLIYFLIFFISIFYLIKSKDKKLLNKSIALSLMIFFICSCFDFPKERPIHLLLISFLFAWASYHSYTCSHKLNLKIKAIYYIIIVFHITFFFKRYISEIKIAKMLMERSENNHKNTIKICNEILELNVQFDQTATPINFYIGEAYFFENQIDSSILYLKKSLQNSPYNLYTWNNLGSAYKSKNDELRSFYCWEKALQISNDFAEPRINLSYAYIHKKDFKKSLEYLKFDIEKENFIKYYSSIKYILIQSILYNQTFYSEVELRNEILYLINDEKRINWLFYKYINENLTFQDQISNDILYSLCENKNIITLIEKKNLTEKYSN